MEKIESASTIYESPDIQNKRRDLVACLLLDVVNESLWEGDSGVRSTENNWKKVDEARNYLLRDPVVRLYFISLSINKESALSSLQEKWHRMDLMYRQSHTEQRVFH
ncbi:hypothetical protein [Acidithiobacillus sulfurivorans]|uniref:Uncharacterized protein n=1 Tax=Acidithiobacillus sulfurivorans TaxID=1958756 RepID=A0ABS6A4Q9_9PROT|nr:hypothetical protein [Acidithiobacillus sulfurivorans]MBU2761688.1 hypothetical protein [Acidithiobacillus sulfurivorans]